ncbi:MAG: hypothetical protein KDB25_07075 [Leucobacter sp.]|nr:hypothetical protein [Leucobacter sp.]
MPRTLDLADHATRDDLRIYLERLLRAGRDEARLIVRDSLLAVFGCTQAPEDLMDTAPVVLVLRSFALSRPVDQPLDLVVPARALLDRLARMGIVGLRLDLPDAEVTAAWAGVLPPAGEWRAEGVIDAASLRGVAEEGMRRITETLPDSPGDPVVRRVRRAVWGTEIAPGLPAAVAFAAESMGFLGSDEPVRLTGTRTWRRLATPRGEVLVRTGPRTRPGAVG